MYVCGGGQMNKGLGSVEALADQETAIFSTMGAKGQNAILKAVVI